MREIAFLDECLLASQLACSPHLTDFGVCLRIELACLLVGTDLGQEEKVYLRFVGRGAFVQSSEKVVLSRLGVPSLLINTKWTRRRCKRDGIRRLCTIRPEKTNDGLIMFVVRQLWVSSYSNNASFPFLRGRHWVRPGVQSISYYMTSSLPYSLGQGYGAVLRTGLS